MPLRTWVLGRLSLHALRQPSGCLTQSSGLRTRRSCLSSLLCDSLLVWPWANCSTSLCLCSPLCKWGNSPAIPHGVLVKCSGYGNHIKTDRWGTFVPLHDQYRGGGGLMAPFLTPSWQSAPWWKQGTANAIAPECPSLPVQGPIPLWPWTIRIYTGGKDSSETNVPWVWDAVCQCQMPDGLEVTSLIPVWDGILIWFHWTEIPGLHNP